MVEIWYFFPFSSQLLQLYVWQPPLLELHNSLETLDNPYFLSPLHVKATTLTPLAQVRATTLTLLVFLRLEITSSIPIKDQHGTQNLVTISRFFMKCFIVIDKLEAL